MGFALTLFYLFTNLLTPAEIVPALLPFRIMLVLLLITLLVSCFTMISSRFSFSSPQMFLLVGLVADGVFTVLYAVRWLPAGIDAVMELLFLAGITLMVCWNVVTLGRLRVLAGLLAATGLIIVVQGIVALETGYRADKFVLHEGGEFDAAGGRTYIDRIQGQGVLSDPNDLGQFLLVDMALLGCCWKPRNLVGNFLKVILPGAFLLTGVLLTRSRGALLALLVLILLLLQKRLGKFGFLLGAGVGVLGLAAMTILAGRGLSMSEGSAAGRLDAWYAGMQMFKGSPLFGVGFQRFTEHHSLTAHNSYMLCLAELGFPGFCMWLGLLVSSLFQVRAIGTLPDPNPAFDDLRQCGRSVFNALMMFVVTAWFLSRSYTTVLFVLVGCAIALTEITKKAGLPFSLQNRAWKMTTLAAACAIVASVYVTLRIRGLA